MDIEKNFKRGDFIVSGRGSVGIYMHALTNEGAFYRLTSTGEHCLTDWFYARYATKEEKEAYIEKAIKANLSDEDRKLLYESAGIKKRFRPTLAGYRELQKENEKLKEDYARSVAGHKQTEADFIDLKGKIGVEYISMEEYIKVAKEVDRLKVETERWNESCKQLEERYNALAAEKKALEEIIVGLKERLNIIKNRGLLARIFNKFPDNTDS